MSTNPQRNIRLAEPDSLDAGLKEIVSRAVRQIKRAKIQQPKSGESVGECHWSKTGWAIQNADGSCTCKPAKAPKVNL